MTVLILALVAVVQLSAAQVERLRWVPNPRVADGTWVSDPSHHLKPATVDSLNAIISALKSETGAELAVVAIDSTSGFEPFDVALALHRAWGVGERGRDNGVVLLWVPPQRAVQISVGYGLEGVLPDARAGRVRDRVIIPAFRRGEFDAGMIEAVRALSDIVREEKNARGSTMSATEAERAGARAVEREPGARVENRTRRRPGLLGGIIAGALLLAGGAAAGAAAYARRRPKKCPRGHGPMLRLDEQADDAHLDSGQRLEERLESVDYDVWICPQCQFALVAPHRAWFSKYSACPSCKRRTLERTTHTLVPATTVSSGTQEVNERCLNCGHTDRRTRSLPKISTSSSSGSSFSGGGGGGGGSSFGGGSAGGGGAGGRY